MENWTLFGSGVENLLNENVNFNYNIGEIDMDPKLVYPAFLRYKLLEGLAP
jgi:hypothetical protein